jgi:hypothetical protein
MLVEKALFHSKSIIFFNQSIFLQDSMANLSIFSSLNVIFFHNQVFQLQCTMSFRLSTCKQVIILTFLMIFAVDESRNVSGIVETYDWKTVEWVKEKDGKATESTLCMPKYFELRLQN